MEEKGNVAKVRAGDDRKKLTDSENHQNEGTQNRRRFLFQWFRRYISAWRYAKFIMARSANN